jgi:nicotinamidase-related amidase
VQERLTPAIPAAPRIVTVISSLVEAASRVGLPILATEQNSRGLGPTVAPLRHYFRPEAIVEKIHFSAPREAAFQRAWQRLGLRRCLIAGCEAHVCVMQTALALLSSGVAVTVIGDAVGSRRDLNRRVALARLARAGAEIAESEAILAALAGNDPVGSDALSR